MHEAFEEYLDTVQLAPEVASLFRALAEERLKGGERSRTRKRRDATERATEAERRLLAINERYHIEGAMDADSYHRLKKQLISKQVRRRP